MNKIKVKDVHHPGVAEEFDRLTVNDIQKLLTKRDQFVDTGCPACHSLNVKSAFNYQGMDYRRCCECELLYVSPAPTEALHLEYVLNSTAMKFWREIANPGMRESRRPMYQERVEYAKKIIQRFKPNSKNCLEVGAGNGEFAQELTNEQIFNEIVVLEPQELTLNMDSIEVITGGFEELESHERTFDVVFAWELIEHILEPDQFLRLVRKVMNSDGIFILSTPNENSVETRTLGTDSSNIIFDHVRLYNPVAITELLSRNGFRVLDISTPGLLDVERLKQHLDKKTDLFSDNPALHFLLMQDDKITAAFQNYLKENLHSSHMRVVATIDGEWKGSKTPVL